MHIDVIEFDNGSLDIFKTCQKVKFAYHTVKVIKFATFFF